MGYEGYNNDSNEREGEPRFNSALDLLERISILLRRISLLHIVHPTNLNDRQREHISLVKSLYATAAPILPKKFIDDYHEKILDLKIGSEINVRAGIQKITQLYSEETEKLLVDIQITLQLSIKNYFMPQGESDDYEL